MNRRSFLRILGAAGSSAALGSARVLGQAPAPAFGPDAVPVPDEGWRMWPDTAAEWKWDAIHLPGEFHLADLPVNPPTGGWAVLGQELGREVTLPATVEQYHWGLTGFRPYHGEYKFETSDPEVKNGAYSGVSWWWRNVDIPGDFAGKRILLRVRAARQRAEVYLNERLVGYSIMEELPFECDLTAAARPGPNLLAIRITNPGGRLDWVDGDRLTWGSVQFQKSHGFGGLDRGMTLSAHGPVRLKDVWVLNTPKARTVTAHAEVENSLSGESPGRVRFAVVDPATGRVLAAQEIQVIAPAGGFRVVAAALSAPEAELWDLDRPALYRLEAEWLPDEAADIADRRSVDFGFRWFAAEGVGRDALFRLNGRRIRLYTSISWGYWALNGLFPTPELAAKEVRAAKAFNLNALNFHRNLAKEEVLHLQDRAGLMRCLEPGGGAQAVQGRPAGFAQRYMLAKILGMIRAFRSHPSVVHYIIQNEGRLDTASPELAELFRRMRTEDPSRSIVGTDGFVMRNTEAWEEAYSDRVRASQRPATPEGGAAGWWVDHSGHATDVWQDGCYVSPRDYYYRSTDRTEIVEWGEMKGPASSDDHAAVLEQIRRHGGESYDRRDHEEILAATDAFLDRWGFRQAFPTAGDLFRSIGRQAYESWGQLMENVRLNDETDMSAISGWESTAIENHSGLVDNFRDFKADPRAIAESLMPVRPLAKQRQLVLVPGGRAVFDLYLLNDSGRPVEGDLVFTLAGPDGTEVLRRKLSAPAYQPDRLSYLLEEAVTSAPLDRPGYWRARFELSGRPEVTHERAILVVAPPSAGPRPIRLALASLPAGLAAELTGLPGVTAEPFRSGERYDVIAASDGGGEPAPLPEEVDSDGAAILRHQAAAPALPPEILAAVRSGAPLLALAASGAAADGLARQLAGAGAFRYQGLVGTSRASWMGAWYFVRSHPLYEGLPTNQALGLYYQVKSSGANGWRVDGDGVEIVAGYGRDHDRHLGAGTLVCRLGSSPVVLHQILGMHPALRVRFLGNAVRYLAANRGRPPAELSKPSWEPQVVGMSGVTDCYQPAERHFRLTRQYLEVLAEFRNPVGVTQDFVRYASPAIGDVTPRLFFPRS